MPLFSRLFGKKRRKGSAGIPNVGILQGANNFTMNNSVMIDRPTVIQALIDGQTILQMLAEKMTPGADVDSSQRYPPPRCHPGTRVWLTKRIQEWLMKEVRMWDFLWLYGAAGVGKSAVAQTVAEYAAEQRRLGAAFFFSESGGRIDYARVWITIAYQLAVRIPFYQTLVAQQLAADPDILNKAPPVLFKRLIADPLSCLPPSSKFLIVLDGLDECETEDAQLNIIDLISGAVRSVSSLPVVWMIFSRPEYHIKQRFFDNDFPIDCGKVEVPIDSKEAKEDVALFARSSFNDIRKKYSDMISESWPSEEDFREIMEAVTGLFAAASTVVRYVDDPEHKDPEARLQSIIHYLRRSGPKNKENPMAKLDDLYTNILSEIPLDILPTTMRLIHYLYWIGNLLHIPPAMATVNFHGISRGEFYRALRNLHSLLDIPFPQDALVEPVEVLHKSFLDYLRDPDRSGRFHRTQDDFGHDLLNDLSRLASFANLLSYGNLEKPPDLPLTWRPTDPRDETILKRQLCLCCQDGIWLLLVIRADGGQDDLNALRNFDYNFFVGMQRSVDPNEFGRQEVLNAAMYCVMQLYEPRFSDTLYTEPRCDTTRRLLEGLQAQSPTALPFPDIPYEEVPWNKNLYYFFLGQDTRSILGVCRGQLNIKFYSTQFPFKLNDQPVVVYRITLKRNSGGEEIQCQRLEYWNVEEGV